MKLRKGSFRIEKEIEVNLYQQQPSEPSEVLTSRDEPKQRNQTAGRDLKERKELLSKSRNEGFQTKNQTLCDPAPKPEVDSSFCSN